MINTKKFQTFLDSDFNDNVKVFVVDFIRRTFNDPTKEAALTTFLLELDIFNDDIKKLDKPNTYYVIDLEYLNTLSPAIFDYIIKSFYEDDTLDLYISLGIIVSNVEYLKMKRARKLKKIEKSKIEESKIKLKKIEKSKIEESKIKSIIDYKKDIAEFYGFE